MEHDLVTIVDWQEATYLDGAQMQFCVYIGKYPDGECIAYCDSLEVARVLANALGNQVVIYTQA